MSIVEQKAYITGRIPQIVEHLQYQPVILPFGQDMYALFCLSDQENIDRMVHVKGRPENKPFVRTSDVAHTENLLTKPGISLEIRSPLLEKIGNLLKKAQEINHPLGLLLPADENHKLPDQLVGKGLVSVNGQRYDTVGFMVSGPDKAYSQVAGLVKGNVFPGTSANISGDTRANGSGHHRLAGALAHFGDKPCAIFVPKRINEGHGPSTTTFMVLPDGRIFLNRIGSTSKELALRLISSVGLKYKGEVDGGAKNILPYNYFATKGGNIMMWGLCKIYQAKTLVDNGFYLSQKELEIIQAVMPKPQFK